MVGYGVDLAQHAGRRASIEEAATKVHATNAESTPLLQVVTGAEIE